MARQNMVYFRLKMVCFRLKMCSYAKANMNPRASAQVFLDQHTLFPGSIITGKVMLKNPFDSILVKKVRISVHGKETIKGFLNGRCLEFLNEEIESWEAEEGKPKNLRAPVCTASFSYKLPEKLPPSYNSNTAKIKYFVKVTVDCVDLKTVKNKECFTVMMGNQLRLNPLDDRSLKLHLSSTMLFNNQWLAHVICLQNDSPHTIHTIHLTISRITTIHLCQNDDCLNSNQPNPPCKKTNKTVFLAGTPIKFKVKPGESKAEKMVSEVLDERIYPTFTGRMVSCSYKLILSVYRTKFLLVAPVIFEVEMQGFDRAPRWISQWKLLEEMAGLGLEERRKHGDAKEEGDKDLIEFD
ncbi:hypothetical protein CAEBREN_03819 [Caenorhabditis brenneri]|uniref:Arrestin-like N-terminal domain-containing protein n=1 Tax=Caenorhabditis brenneri TaxID=135651 RepID=G0MN41_CAEBE|nr:hypothetical protein CAEBREN_03819 [Caenorhabditis brenneri]